MIASIVAGLGYGDEGKGNAVDFLSRRWNSDLTVKYTGGPQATHNVELPDGRNHRFSMFGSGTFAGCRTHLTRHVLIEPHAIVAEAAALKALQVPDPMRLLSIDNHCAVITPWHWISNRLREALRGDKAHGSCGAGIGETVSMRNRGLALTFGELQGPPKAVLARLRMIKDAVIETFPADLYGKYQLYEDLHREDPVELCDFYMQWASDVKEARYVSAANPVFEGAQGVLLDEEYGFAPHNTWGNTTFDNAISVCREWDLVPHKIGVLRSYMTRHGAGPFVTEDAAVQFPDINTTNAWQGNFRQGHFDLPMARHAISSCRGIDELMLTHMDRVTLPWRYCASYGDSRDSHVETTAEWANGCYPVYEETQDPALLLSSRLHVPIHHLAYGPTHNDWRQRGFTEL